MEWKRWLHVFRPVAKPRVRLVCLPYAGGAATVFHAWPSGLPQDVEVVAAQLPGRQERLSEPPLTHLDTCADMLFKALATLPKAPLAIYGHSFGAVLGFQLARRLQRAEVAATRLIVAARRAPHIASSTPSIHDLPMPAFIEAMHRRYGTPLAILQNRDLMELTLPSLKADLQALETHQHLSEPLLATPITALHGRGDPMVALAEMAAWGELTRSSFAVHEVDGGHFFLDAQRAWTLSRVAEALVHEPVARP